MSEIRLAKAVRLDEPPVLPERVRVALVQIDYNPAYRYKIDYLVEPASDKAESSSAMSTLSLQDPSMERQWHGVLAKIRQQYIECIQSKLQFILSSLRGCGIDIVCFPEYSVPAEVIPSLVEHSREFSLVLPSHIATRQTLKQLSSYFRCEVPWHPGQALYVALTKDEAFILPKVTKSKFEPSLNVGSEAYPLPLLGQGSSVVVAMCSDFIQGRLGKVQESNPLLQYLETATIRIVCSHTPSTEPFFEIASQDLLRSWSLNRRPTVFVNNCDAGGTSVFSLMAREQVLDPVTPESSYRIPPHVEAVAVYDLALGPQLNVRPAPLNPEPVTEMTQFRVMLYKNSEAADGEIGNFWKKMSGASSGVLRNIENGMRQLRDLATPQMESNFRPMELGPESFVINWRYHAAATMYEFLASIRPSLEAIDRRSVDVRIDALEFLAGKRSLDTRSVQQVASSRFGDEATRGVRSRVPSIVFEHGGSALAVFRLTQLPANAPIEQVVRPMWSLLSSILGEDRLSIEIRYEMLKGEEVGSASVLHDLTIEVFFVIRYNLHDGGDKNAATLIARDIGGLLQTGFGESYRFTPVSESLWQRYRSAQAMDFRILAGHTVDRAGDKETLLPFNAQPRITEVLRFLYSRGERAALSVNVAALNSSCPLSYYQGSLSRDVFPSPPLSHKVEKNLDDALDDLSLLDLLRPPSRFLLDEPICKLEIALELLGAPSSVVPEVVMQYLLGEEFSTRSEKKIGNSWCSEELPDKLGNIYFVGSLRETLGLLRFPAGSLPSYGDRTSLSVFQVPIEAVESRDGCMIGESFHRDAADGIPVYLSSEDRKKHLYVVGKTGSGKTQFLLNVIMQDIEVGRGVCVMDPHGDLYEDILSRFPVRRSNDLVLFDPTDTENPPGLNLFEYDRRDPLQRDFVLDEAVSIFLRLFGSEVFGARIQNYFRSGVLALMNDPARDRTLLDIARLFLDDDFFSYIMNSVSDPAVKDFMAEFKRTASREKDEMVPYFQSKFTPFVSNSIIRRVVGQSRSTVGFRAAMDGGKVVLVNLSKGKLGELNSRLLGMILVSKVTWAALNRAHLPRDQRSEFFLYCDEFQSFATDSFGLILSEARKYGLCLTLANQYLGQLRITDNYTTSDRDSLRDAVLGNVGNVVAFRVGAKDARTLVEELAGRGESADKLGDVLSTQARFHAIAKLDCRGLPTHPFTIRSILCSVKSDVDRGEMIAEYVKKKTLLPKAFVESDISSARSDYSRL